MERVINRDDYTVSFKDTPEVHKAVFDYLLENYFVKHDAFSGEVICQNDECNIEASHVLSQIADNVIQFRETDKADK